MSNRFCSVVIFVFLGSFSLQSVQASPKAEEHPAQPAPGSIADEKWHRCEADDQWVAVYKCDDDAVNKKNLDEYQKLAQTTACKTTLTHNSNVVAHCVHNNCTARVELSHR